MEKEAKSHIMAYRTSNVWHMKRITGKPLSSAIQHQMHIRYIYYIYIFGIYMFTPRTVITANVFLCMSSRFRNKNIYIYEKKKKWIHEDNYIIDHCLDVTFKARFD
jgi:hypothetical protein